MRLWNKNEELPECLRILARSGKEVWTPVPASPETHQVSTLGNVVKKSRSGTWNLLKGSLVESGYRSVGIPPNQGKHARTWQVHRLVVETFDGPPPTPAHTDVRHLNGIKTDNRLCNLLYGTRSENMQDVWIHRRQGLPSVEERLRDQEKSDTRSWYQGYTDDPYLLRVGLDFFHADKLTAADLTLLWRCTREVAENIIHGVSRRLPDYVPPEKQSRRTPHRKKEILDLVTQGLNAAQINEKLNENLTAQDVYYYKKQAPGAAVSTLNEKMSDALVLEILQMAKETGWGAPRLAKHFGKSTATLSSILAGTSYTHVTRPITTTTSTTPTLTSSP